MKIRRGDTIEGFCGGYFGRDSYYDKICIYVGDTPHQDRYAVFFERYWRADALYVIHGKELKQLEKYLDSEYYFYADGVYKEVVPLELEEL